MTSFCSDKDFKFHANTNKLLPLNTYGIRSIRFSTKHGIVEIDKDGWMLIEIPKHKRNICISSNGVKVIILLFNI